jgi:hypothetical protein
MTRQVLKFRFEKEADVGSVSVMAYSPSGTTFVGNKDVRDRRFEVDLPTRAGVPVLLEVFGYREEEKKRLVFAKQVRVGSGPQSEEIVLPPSAPGSLKAKVDIPSDGTPDQVSLIRFVDGDRHGSGYLAGEHGVCEMTGIPPGNYLFRIDDDRGGSWSKKIQIRPGEIVDLGTIQFKK